VGEEAGVVYAPHEFLLVSKLDACECCVVFVEFEVGSVLRGAGEKGTVFSGVREGCVGVFGAVCVCIGFEVGVFVGYVFA
jgi:hypothetical protein